MTDINPLNVLNQREVPNPPDHFTTIEYKIPLDKAYISTNRQLEHIRNWIFNKLDGRFFVLVNELNDSVREVCYVYTVGFEVEEESTFFALAYEA
jgi:hypothetical protein